MSNNKELINVNTVYRSEYSAEYIKKAEFSELSNLAEMLRDDIISTVKKNGGHLASNLGIVEATIILHRLFDLPKDKIIFDVGHQCYAHKLLSGRAENFKTLRQFGGISGFTKREESEYDPLSAGHSGSALSAAVGYAEAERLSGGGAYTICVIGDGSFTNGMVYEAINSCAERKLRLIIILNDNEMSISKNVGALSRRLSKIRTSKKYFSFKHFVKKTCSSIPVIGVPMTRIARFIRDCVKRIVIKSTLLENMGLDYLGPVDGNDMKKLETVLSEAKTKETVCLVHMVTKKGKGYSPAESNPEKWHSAAPFELADNEQINTAINSKNKESFSEVFGSELCRLAEKDGRICAVTAAMTGGTGLDRFAELYPDRFFDVGIAEEHEVTFAGGLSAGGLRPVCAVYSTFAQRAYDQLLLDVSLQKIPFVLALDRAGIVPGDGVTHQGIYDYSLFSTIPDVTIYSPETYDELRQCLTVALNEDKFSVLRYPRGCEIEYNRSLFEYNGKYHIYGCRDAEVLFITYGRLTHTAYMAAEKLKISGVKVCIVKLVKIFPICTDILKEIISKDTKLVYLLNEGIHMGGFGEKISAALMSEGYGYLNIINHSVEYGFVPHGKLNELDEFLGFTPEKISDTVLFRMKRLK